MQFKEPVEVKLKEKFNSFETTMSQQQVFNDNLLSIENKLITSEFLCQNQTVGQLEIKNRQSEEKVIRLESRV